MLSSRIISLCCSNLASGSGIRGLQVLRRERGRDLRRLLSDSSSAPNLPKSSGPKKDTRRGPLSWASLGFSLACGGAIVAYIWYLRGVKDAEEEKARRRTVGKSLIGGPWSLRNAATGKLESQDDYLGKWVLIYFGFTHCPDICPDELNKMVKVHALVDSDQAAPSTIVPFFFTVDPERDTAAAVKKYCAEFSPKLVGFVGDKEEVGKVSRTFRVYHSQGPRDEFNDYIVDHTVIMYLIDPTGQFVDYYGQNRTAEEIAEAIQMQMLKFNMGKKKGWW